MRSYHYSFPSLGRLTPRAVLWVLFGAVALIALAYLLAQGYVVP